MTTPATMNAIIARLNERLEEARKEAVESHKAAMNSYGAGFDAGYVASLSETLMEITGDEPA